MGILCGYSVRMATSSLCRQLIMRTKSPIYHQRQSPFQRYLSSNTSPTSKDGSKPRPNKTRTRILLFGAGFLALHLCVGFAKRLSKGRKKESESNEDILIEEFHDADYGKNKLYKFKGYIFPYFVKDALGKLESFLTRDRDVIIASFPKSGTTWVQEIVYLIESDLDVKAAQSQNMEERFSYIEFIYPGIAAVARKAGPRLIKTHMPYSLIPASARQGKGKVIYIARNPKDVCVSDFHFVRMLNEIKYQGDFHSFAKKFINDQVPYGPWSSHVIEYWRHRDDSNILFITYEELQTDIHGGIRKIANFLGKDLQEWEVELIAKRCGFEAMRSNPAANYTWWDELGIKDRGTHFMRKGKVGDWKNYFDPSTTEEMDKMCKEKLKPHGLIF